VSDGQAGNDRHVELTQPRDHRVLSVRPAVCPRAEHDALHTVEPAGAQQLGQPVVEPEGDLADVFQHGDAPVRRPALHRPDTHRKQ